MTTSTRKLLLGAAALTVLLPSAFASPAAAAGDYGPETCLEGYVWRDAVPQDHVCVTRATRDQAARDNAAAASRRVAGSATCVQGFVWREVRAGDRVCVTPDVRQKAREDNAAHPLRRNALTIRTAGWVTPPVCDGDVCTTTNESPRIRVMAEQVNLGRAKVNLYRTNGQGWRAWSVPVRPYADGRPGGRVDFKSPLPRCSGAPNGYIRVIDLKSGRRSAKAPIRTCQVID